MAAVGYWSARQRRVRTQATDGLEQPVGGQAGQDDRAHAQDGL